MAVSIRLTTANMMQALKLPPRASHVCRVVDTERAPGAAAEQGSPANVHARQRQDRILLHRA
jgi:hypothetical protein